MSSDNSGGGSNTPPPGWVPQRRATDYQPMVPPPITTVTSKTVFTLFKDGVPTVQFVIYVIVGLIAFIFSLALWYSGVNANADKIKTMEPKVEALEKKATASETDVKAMKESLNDIYKRLQDAITELDKRNHDSFVSVDTRLNDDRSSLQHIRDSQELDRRQMDQSDAVLRGDLAVLAERVKGLIDRQPPLPLTVPSKSR